MYKINSPLCLIKTGQWLPAGEVNDLRGISKKFIGWALENGTIEKVDGTPDDEPEIELADYKGCCG